MAELFLIAVDLDELEQGKGLDIKKTAYLGHVYITATPENLHRVLLFLQANFGACRIHVDVTRLGSLKDIISLLDHGAAKAFVERQQLQKLLEARLLADCGRLVVSVDASTFPGKPEDLIAEVARDVTALTGDSRPGVHLHGGSNGSGNGSWELSNTASKSMADFFSGRYVTRTTSSNPKNDLAADDGYVPIFSAAAITTQADQPAESISLFQLLTRNLKTDREDGLFSTVVVDASGSCLGLVYSNQESIQASLQRGVGVYWSRSRNQLWVKGETSGNTQELIRIDVDCDADALRFTVRQRGSGFCHLNTTTCWGPVHGLAKLEKTLMERRAISTPGSYTQKLFDNPKMLEAKLMEEASELCAAQTPAEVAAEAADLLYFALTKCVSAGVSLADVERNLDLKSMKVQRRPGEVKPKWAAAVGLRNGMAAGENSTKILNPKSSSDPTQAIPEPEANHTKNQDQQIKMRRYHAAEHNQDQLMRALQRPSQKSSEQIMAAVKPIIEDVRLHGDEAVLRYTHKFEKATSLQSAVIKAPFPSSLMQLSPETMQAIDTSFENIRAFHAAQEEKKPLRVETMPGVVCSRFSRPIERVGLYVPGGTAVLPSTAMMLGVPAMVAGCSTIILASPPRSDGSITPEIVYIAHKIGAESIVLAGGAQAIAAMAYGTASISKVDKILGPGNQFVTAAKMLVANDTTACVAIDMPAGPSEVLVVADASAPPAFVAADLLSQAEHGADSQVVLIAVGLEDGQLAAIEAELNTQARALPRLALVRAAIEHSLTLVVPDLADAMRWSNAYAPEHLILQIENTDEALRLVQNAGSVFIGAWTPESVGDYSAGVNHSLPTYGYARQYSGVNLASFTKHITSSALTPEGLRNVAPAVLQLARVEELEAHRRAVAIRLQHLDVVARDDGRN